MAYYDFGGYGGFPRYVPVGERRAKALLQAKKLEKRGRVLEPVTLAGKRIASSFWGKEWCQNLESYMDFTNRLPRGRTYLRARAVLDLRIGPGQIDALVAGSSLYEVSVRIDKLARKRWGALIKRCAGRIDSVVELLRGGCPRRCWRRWWTGTRGSFRRRGRSTTRAPARTTRRSASTSPRCSTAWGRGWTRSPSCSSRCAAWPWRNWWRRARSTARGRRRMRSTVALWRESSGSSWTRWRAGVAGEAPPKKVRRSESSASR